MNQRRSQRIYRKPLWVAIALCALGGILLGATLSKAVQQSFVSSNAVTPSRMVSTSTPSGLGTRSSAFSTSAHTSAAHTSSVHPKIPTSPVKPTLSRRPQNRHSASGSAALQGQNTTDRNTADQNPTCIPSPQQSPKPHQLMGLKQLPLTRFRVTAQQAERGVKESIRLAHFTNFGWRFLRDWFGRSAQHSPIIVLHETVGSFESTMEVFSSNHPDDDDQVSYHAVIRENGEIVYVVPPEYRAYGAGDSVFINADRQAESVQTRADSPPSVNNFAYHISLVTPLEGRHNGDRHSGYTKNQYEALAWLVAKTGISDDRITTHQIIDRSGTRTDPRSFNAPYFLQRLHAYPRTQEIPIGCTLADAPFPPNMMAN